LSPELKIVFSFANDIKRTLGVHQRKTKIGVVRPQLLALKQTFFLTCFNGSKKKKKNEMKKERQEEGSKKRKYQDGTRIQPKP
jgi:hypothetical protein